MAGRRETSIANAVVLQRKYFDCVTQGPSILFGPAAAKNASLLGDRLHWSQLLDLMLSAIGALKELRIRIDPHQLPERLLLILQPEWNFLRSAI